MTNSEAINVAIHELKVAQNHFDYCDHDHIDYCIYKLNAAKEKLRLLLKREREAA